MIATRHAPAPFPYLPLILAQPLTLALQILEPFPKPLYDPGLLFLDALLRRHPLERFRGDAQAPPLSPLPAQFCKPWEYFPSFQPLILEEACAVIEQGLRRLRWKPAPGAQEGSRRRCGTTNGSLPHATLTLSLQEVQPPNSPETPGTLHFGLPGHEVMRLGVDGRRCLQSAGVRGRVRLGQVGLLSAGAEMEDCCPMGYLWGVDVWGWGGVLARRALAGHLFFTITHPCLFLPFLPPPHQTIWSTFLLCLRIWPILCTQFMTMARVVVGSGGSDILCC